jgi:hypothetical protein
MASRQAVDYLGNPVATISEPEGITWSEEMWAEKLAVYAKPPPSEQEALEYNISVTVSQRRAMAEEIIEEMKKENLLAGINVLQALWVHNRLRALSITVGGVPFTIDLMNLVVSGDLEVAYVALGATTPDDMSMPFHFLSSEKIESYRLKIARKLGWA